MITGKRVITILKEAGVLRQGHFELISGRYSTQYLQYVKIFKNPKYSVELCGALSEQYRSAVVEVVVGPTIGTIQMVYKIGKALGSDDFCRARA